MFQKIPPNYPMGGSPGILQKGRGASGVQKMQEVIRKQNEPRRFSFERLKLELLELELLGLQLRESGSRGPGVLEPMAPRVLGPGVLVPWGPGVLVSWSPGITATFEGSDPPPIGQLGNNVPFATAK